MKQLICKRLTRPKLQNGVVSLPRHPAEDTVQLPANTLAPEALQQLRSEAPAGQSTVRAGERLITLDGVEALQA